MRGRFISIEGVEAVGKSTVIDHVIELLKEDGITAVKTAEPGGTQLCREIRRILLTYAGPEKMTDMTELLLYFAARAQHLEHYVNPELEAGHWVVTDRFTHSTLAYQGGGRGLSKELIMDVANNIHADRWPDLTLILDADLDLLAQRLAGRELDRIEREDREFFVRVQQTYRDLAQVESRCKLIDAGRPLADVLKDVSTVVNDFKAGLP